MSIEVLHIRDYIFCVDEITVEVYRDMSNDILTNPRLEPKQIDALKSHLKAMDGSQ